MMVSEPPHQNVIQHGQSTNEVMLLEHHASTTAMLAQQVTDCTKARIGAIQLVETLNRKIVSVVFTKI